MGTDVINGQMLESLNDVIEDSNIQYKSVYLSIDRNVVDAKENDNDFRYISDAIPKKPFLPAPLCEYSICIIYKILYECKRF